MSRTWWGHYIIIDKGEEYIRFKDYLELSNRIDEAIEYINKYESIKAYYEYEECGYEEYNYDNDFKDDLLEILKGKDEYKLPFDEEVQSGLGSLSIRGKDER